MKHDEIDAGLAEATRRWGGVDEAFQVWSAREGNPDAGGTHEADKQAFMAGWAAALEQVALTQPAVVTAILERMEHALTPTRQDYDCASVIIRADATLAAIRAAWAGSAG